jgi:hypothetical protein
MARKKTFKLISLKPVRIHNWVIKLSSSEAGIMAVMYNIVSRESIANFFKDEFEANAFINMWIEKHATD